MKEAIILAGGFGTRLRHVVSDVPKPMAPIGGRPFLEFLLDYLLDFDFQHVVLSTGYMHEKIESHFGSQYKGLRLSYAREESPLGTGGGMLNAAQHCREDEFVVLNGDTMFRIDYDHLIRFHQQHGGLLSVVLRQVDDTSRYGSVATDGEDRIIQFTEKSEAQGSGLINGGIYMINRHIFDGLSLGQPFSFEKDIMQVKVALQDFYATPSDDYFIDIGVPEDYYRFCQEGQRYIH